MSTGQPERPRLIADIGGTNARFALVPADGDVPVQERVLPGADYPDFAAAAEAYLAGIDGPRPAVGFCAIANPVTGDFLSMTNHDWAFSIDASRRQLGFESLRFINDFSAQALAVPYLPAADKVKLGGGEAMANRPIGVLGPGTGLGVSGLVPFGEHWVPIEGEGGHVTYSPVTPREFAVASELRRRFGHCSAERLVSGLGLKATYQALCAVDGVPAGALEPDAISARAADGSDPLCGETITIFTAALATTAANLAVTLGALGGIYLCGGILPRLGGLFDSGRFRERFEEKGRFREYLEAVPTYVVHARHPALLGLAKTLGPGS